MLKTPIVMPKALRPSPGSPVSPSSSKVEGEPSSSSGTPVTTSPERPESLAAALHLQYQQQPSYTPASPAGCRCPSGQKHCTCGANLNNLNLETQKSLASQMELQKALASQLELHKQLASQIEEQQKTLASTTAATAAGETEQPSSTGQLDLTATLNNAIEMQKALRAHIDVQKTLASHLEAQKTLAYQLEAQKLLASHLEASKGSLFKWR